MVYPRSSLNQHCIRQNMKIRSFTLVISCASTCREKFCKMSLQRRHDECDGVSNHQPQDFSLNRLFKAQIKDNIKAPRHWPFWWEFIGDRWLPRTKAQWRGKCFHLMTSSWYFHFSRLRVSPYQCSVMPQSHPTTGPVRFLSPVRFLARKAEWSARRNFTSVLFSWSHHHHFGMSRGVHIPFKPQNFLLETLLSIKSI